MSESATRRLAVPSTIWKFELPPQRARMQSTCAKREFANFWVFRFCCCCEFTKDNTLVYTCTCAIFSSDIQMNYENSNLKVEICFNILTKVGLWRFAFRKGKIRLSNQERVRITIWNGIRNVIRSFVNRTSVWRGVGEQCGTASLHSEDFLIMNASFY